MLILGGDMHSHERLLVLILRILFRKRILLPRDAVCIALYCYSKSSVRPSVRPTVRLSVRDIDVPWAYVLG